MAGGKLSARQKMINMMYLVLTALLALNVSKEILDAFISIDEGQLNTRSSLETKLDQQMGNFSALARENAEKYGDPYKVAEKVQKDIQKRTINYRLVQRRDKIEKEFEKMFENK